MAWNDEEFVDRLRKPVTVDTFEMKSHPAFIRMGLSIFSNPKQNGVKEVFEGEQQVRTLEQVVANIEHGKAVEDGVHQLFGMKLEWTKFDCKDRITHAFDLEYKGIRTEIKSTRYTNAFFIGEHPFKVLKTNIAEGFVDNIIVCKYEKLTEHSIWVQPTFVLNAATFTKFVPEEGGEYNLGYSFRRGECVDLLDYFGD